MTKSYYLAAQVLRYNPKPLSINDHDIAIIHALGSIEDHIHVVVSIPPKIAIAECVKHFKGASSREITRVLGEDFQWQAGYGALSLGGRSLPTVMAYANHQAQHHSAGATISVYERISEDDDGPVLQAPV